MYDQVADVLQGYEPVAVHALVLVPSDHALGYTVLFEAVKANHQVGD